MQSTQTLDLFDFTRAELAQKLSSELLARQIFTQKYRRPDHTVSSRLHPISQTSLHIHSKTVSQDNSVKVIWSLRDQSLIESVLIPHESDGITACVSSQVGCALKCSFCETGRDGLKRNCSSQEILAQIYQLSELAHDHYGKPLTHLVFMGMGEPLQNHEALFRVLEIIQDPFGWSWSRRKIIVSTAGWVPGMRALSDRFRIRLAVSLHSAKDATRRELMPVHRRYPLEEVLQASRHYAHTSGLAIFFEITLLKDINDSVDDALALIPIAESMPCLFNLIPYNPGANALPHHQRPDPARIKAFQHALVSRGVTATVRYSAGQDIGAACGQLTSRI